MSHVEYVHIKNFKSIRDLKLEGCRRINLFLGYPNVGKSNLLEALSLFSTPYLDTNENINKLIRAENKNDFFYNATGKFCTVETNLEKVQVEVKSGLTISLNTPRYNAEYRFSNQLNLEDFYSNCEVYNVNQLSEFKRYTFHQTKKWTSIGDEQLLPPFGENIIDTLSYSSNVGNVKTWLKNELTKFNLEYILDKSSNSIKVQRRLNSEEVFQLPYSSIADTLQRLIFYKTAIASNKDSVLLFEEPGAHAFPPYISTLTNDIINSVGNQFFITTHSPFVVNDFIEEKRSDVAIYLVGYKDEQTVARKLSEQELDEVYSYGIDLFFNLENYL